MTGDNGTATTSCCRASIRATRVWIRSCSASCPFIRTLTMLEEESAFSTDSCSARNNPLGDFPYIYIYRGVLPARHGSAGCKRVYHIRYSYTSIRSRIGFLDHIQHLQIHAVRAAIPFGFSPIYIEGYYLCVMEAQDHGEELPQFPTQGRHRTLFRPFQCPQTGLLLLWLSLTCLHAAARSRTMHD